MKIKEGALEIHRGDCGCVRVAFHVVDAGKELQGLAYDEEAAKILKRRQEKKLGVPLTIERRKVFTIARHVDDAGRMT
jgi:hypothetical protein